MRTILFSAFALLVLYLPLKAQNNGVQKLTGEGVVPTVSTPNLQPMVFSNDYIPAKETPFG